MARPAVVASIAAVLTLSGCERSDPGEAAVRSAAVRLASLSPNGQLAPRVQKRADVYKKVIADLQAPRGGSAGGSGGSASANLLLAEAHLGVGSIAAAEAAEIEGAVLARVTTLRSAVSTWLQQNSQADAASGYDPTLELAQIDKTIAEKTAQIGEATNKLAAVNGRVADIRARSSQAAEQAKAKRAEEAQVRQQAVAAAPGEAYELLKNAVAIARQADEFDKQAGLHDAQADVLAPEAVDFQSAINQLRSQQELLESSKKTVQRRADGSRALAQRARESAKKTDALIASLADEVRGLRSGPVSPELADSTGVTRDLAQPLDEAAKAYTQAASAAKGALTDAPAMANLALGRAQQALGDLHWSHADLLNVTAQSLKAAASATPRPTNADDYARLADEAAKQQAEALGSAKTAFEGAVDAFDKAARNDPRTTAAISRSPEAKASQQRAEQRLARVKAMLSDALYTVSGGAVDRRAELSGKGGDEPASGEKAPAAAAAEPGSPAAAIDEMLDAVRAGRFGPLAESVHTGDAALQPVVGQLTEVLDAAAAFNTAVQKKFGKSFFTIAMEGIQANPMMQSMMGSVPGGDPTAALDAAMAQFAGLSSAAMQITTEGDTATVLPPADGNPAPTPMKMRKVGGRWKIDLSEPVATAKATNPDFAKHVQLAQFALPLVRDEIRQLTAKVPSFDSTQTMMGALAVSAESLMKAIQPKMQQLGIQMPGMPGMPGGAAPGGRPPGGR